MKEIYTIGHSNYPVEFLLKRLNIHKVNCLIDVRSTPYSKYTPQYNAPNLKKYLNSMGIYYMHMGEELGARQLDENLYSSEGYLDFNKFSRTDLFQRGIERVKDGMKKDFKVALMCTEKDPIDCHRNILVAREFYKQGYNVKNILINSKIESQSELEQRLLEMYFPNRLQSSIFELIEGTEDEKVLIDKAYKRRNSEIGYKLSSNRDEEEE
ncbi:DUF488 domain-containing protein [Clostridium estertheticum]|uniref:DUF488 domain-containing protein n=1 Tax=Clostridium estertheticum TaxID=238834 RepID=A0A5N7IXM0_9CLOT|nr:DUF488 domain-containing protein [Clostridium estertheticum]MPQ30547.1 DUF488 domain-containing protein [Clostridium estertheticum]MPQ61223.1 DUF488 domain-containing protein [Clostridium estertheticum]